MELSSILYLILGIAILLVILFITAAYVLYIRPTLRLWRNVKIVRAILSKLPMPHYKFNANGLRDLRTDATTIYAERLDDEERKFLDTISLDTFAKIGKFIKRK